MLLFEDVRSAWRDVVRRPVATAGAAGMLALGIGLTTALFGALDAVLLRPLPVRDADRVLVAWTHELQRGYAHFPLVERAWRLIEEHAQALAAVAAVESHGWSERPLGDAGATRAVRQARVLGDFFGVLGVQPALGRLTTPADALPGDAGFAVLSHGFWQRAFGGAADVEGRTLRVGQRSLTVVGVLPPGFDYPRGAELWTPLRPVEDARPQLELDIVARLRPGATRGEAASGIERLLHDDADLGRTYGGAVVITRGLREHLLGDVGPILLVLLAGAALVLLVAVANVANLLLVRGAARAPERALRVALGAGARDLVRRLFAEGLLIGGLAAAAGLAVAVVTLRLVLPLAPAGTPGLDAAGLDGRAFAVALALAALVVAACTLAPAIAGSRAAGGPPARGRSRRILGVIQVALAVAALVAAQLLVRTFNGLRTIDPGFRAESLHLLTLAAPYGVFDVPETYLDALASVAARLEARSDVAGATPVLNMPLAESGVYAAPLGLEGQSAEDVRRNPLLNLEVVLPDHFETLGIGIRRGRGFGATDDAGAARVLVVSEATARLVWPDGDAVGKRVALPFPGHENEVWTVVGVAADTRYQALLEPRPLVYLPLLQFRSFAPARMLVRTRGVPTDLLEAAQRAFDETDPRTRVLGAEPVEEILRRPLAGPRFAATVLVVFALAAMLLAAAGVHAVMAAAVRERTREFGVRMALGARRADVWRIVLRRGIGIAAAGIPLGLAVAVAAGRRAGSLLFGVHPTHVTSLLTAALAIVTVVVVACAVPAARAARVDPAATLRAD